MKLVIKCGQLRLGNVMPEFERRLPRLYQSMGEAYMLFIRDNVEKEQSPDGVKWRPLSPWTASRQVAKGKRRGFHPILRVTGRMTDLYVQVEASGVRVGTNAEYAPLQQYGGKSAKGHDVPARPWLFDSSGGVPERFRALLAQMAAEEIGKCLP